MPERVPSLFMREVPDMPDAGFIHVFLFGDAFN